MWRSAASVILDREGRYIDADEAALELLGVQSVDALRALPPDAFAPAPPDPEERQAWREAFFASGASGVLGETTLRRLDGELVRVRVAIFRLPDGDDLFQALFYPVERPTTNLKSRLFTIADVLSEWRSAERRLAALDPASDEARRLEDEVALLRSQYQALFRKTASE